MKLNEFEQSEHATFISWNHVFNIDVCIFPSVFLQNLQGLLDQIGQILILTLPIIDLISDVY
jgi:hypothetical protein